MGGGDPAAAGTSYSYDIATGKAAALPGIVGAVEGEVRCATIFWLELTPLSGSGASKSAASFRGLARLHRYDLVTRREIGGPIALGATSANGSGAWRVDWPGWDVSRDGARLIYQQMTVTFDGMQNTIVSTFREANADNTNAKIILAGPATVFASGAVRLTISPDGRQVAMTNSPLAPAVISGPFIGADGVKAYSPAAMGQPAWLPDGSGFIATAHDVNSPAGVYQYWPGTPPLGPGGTIPGVELSQGGANPATLP
jgi:hypothetical protein